MNVSTPCRQRGTFDSKSQIVPCRRGQGMDKIIYSCILLLFPVFTSSIAHPAHAFYVSIMEISWEQNAQSGQLVFKIFTDDLEDAIYFRHRKRINIQESLEEAETLKLITNYVQSHVSVRLEGRTMPWIFEEAENLQDAVSLVFRIERAQIPEEISVSNSILTELFDTQANIIRFDIAGQKKILKLDKEHTADTQRF